MAQRNIIVLGDRTSHGGTVISAWGQDGPWPMTIEGKFVACVGDYVYCPRCKGSHRIIQGAENPPMDLNGRLIATEGCLVSDGSKLISVGQSMAWYESDGEAEAAEAPLPAAKGIQTASSASGISAEEARLLAQADKEKELDYGISLKRGGNRVLTPLGIPDFKELPSGRTRNTELIDFEVANSRDPAESVSIEVLDGGRLIYSEPDTSRFLSPGRHHWQWDGYGADGVLDTRMLKSKTLTVRLTAAQGGKRQVRELGLGNRAKEVDWLDAKVDRNSKEVEIILRPGFSDGGVKGKDTTGQVVPLTYMQLLMLAKQGIEHYWSRDGNRPGGVGAPINTAKGAYKVNVTVDLIGYPKTKNFKLTVILKANPGRFDRSNSIGIWSSINHYTVYQGKMADEEFKRTAAHEIGHCVLDKYGTGSYSSRHKGTSTYWLQEKLQNNPYPTSGDVDLMHYHSTPPQSFKDRQDRSVAAEQDVKSLLWLARVYFNG